MEQLSRKNAAHGSVRYPQQSVPSATDRKRILEFNADASMPQLIPSSRRSVLSLALALTVAGCAPTSTTQTTDQPIEQSIGQSIDWPMPTPAAVAKIALLPVPYNKGSVVNGRDIFRDCAGCHTLERNGGEANGPNLHAVFGRRAASNAGYPYSEALRNSNIVWDLPHLNQWIFNPHETLPGTSMAYIGIRNDVKRRDLIVYLIAATSDTDAQSR
jgi:cytochrome c